jgi:hypothetical protein
MPFASSDALRQAAADALEAAGLKLSDRLTRVIGGRVPSNRPVDSRESVPLNA